MVKSNSASDMTAGAFRKTSSLRTALLLSASFATALIASSGAAFAQTAAAGATAAAPASTVTPPATAGTPAATATVSTAPAPAAPPASWASTITFGAQIEGGIQGNGDRPADGLNFGRLFDDKANTVLLNQLQLTATRPLNTAATGYDFGFTLQGTYGSDVRYLHYLGEFTHVTNDRNQLTLLQANVLVHTPWLTTGGIDWKIGQFVTSIGYETIDPSTNPFYSHSYIFNYGPFQHTGVLGVLHLNPTVDIYGQVDTGESTTFGRGTGDENSRPAGLAGFGLNGLAGGKLTLLALSHFGPENSLLVDANANSDMRYETDGIATYKATPALTFVTELNWQHDDVGGGVNNYAGTQYISYALTPTITLNGRAEIYRDDDGFFVFSNPGNEDPVRAFKGLPNTSFNYGPATYSEFTVGFTYKPTVPKVATLMFRPEIRWDKTLSGTRAYDAGTQTGNFTFGGDIVLGF